MRTLFRAIKLCIGLFVLMAAIFTKPQLVVEPGLSQLAAFVLVLAGTIGIAFALQANFNDSRGRDLLARVILGGFSVFVILSSNMQAAALGLIPVTGFLAYWFVRHRRVETAA